jgi:RTX calcium-binding nonapeptide repeat (4 copies)
MRGMIIAACGFVALSAAFPMGSSGQGDFNYTNPPPIPAPPDNLQTVPCPTGTSGGVTCGRRGKVLFLLGTTGNDRIVGTNGVDVAWASSGNDRITLLGGADGAAGERGNDTIRGEGSASASAAQAGTPGADKIFGGPGNDRIDGGAKNDRLAGEGGNDRLTGGTGNDRLSGGSGKDRLSARDRRRDRVRCGRGSDSVRADKRDLVARDCERR